jgi:anti-sigma B factor antagonist
MTIGNQIQQLEWSVDEIIKNKHRKIVLDMARVTHIDSSAIGALVACQGKVRQSGGEMRIAGVQDRVLSILKMVHVDLVLTLDPSSDDSVSALAASA